MQKGRSVRKGERTESGYQTIYWKVTIKFKNKDVDQCNNRKLRKWCWFLYNNLLSGNIEELGKAWKSGKKIQIHTLYCKPKFMCKYVDKISIKAKQRLSRFLPTQFWLELSRIKFWRANTFLCITWKNIMRFNYINILNICKTKISITNHKFIDLMKVNKCREI